MPEVLIELDSKFLELKKLEDKREELTSQQEKILVELWNKKIDIAKKIKENSYYFSHPTIQYKSLRGPILGYSSEDNYLYVFELGKGIKEINLYSQDEKISRWRKIIELGMFEDAYSGLTYLDIMIDRYISDSQKLIDKLESELNGKY